MRFGQFRLQGPHRRLQALQLRLQLVALAQQRRLAPLRAGDALLLLADAALPLFHVPDEDRLDLRLRSARCQGEPGEVRVVGLPAVALEQPLRLDDLRLLGALPDVGDDAGDLVERADLGRARPRLGREDAVEVGIEGEEHRRAHGGQEHHPQHGILGNQPHALDVRPGDVAALPEAEDDERQQHQGHREVERYVGETLPVGA
jgi:hypothetical protein